MWRSASGTRQMSAVSGNGRSTTFGLEDALARRRVLQQFLRGAPRPAHQLAAAVRTASPQRVLRTARAEGALEGADVRRVGVAGEIGVTAFAVRPQLQHGWSSIAVEEILHFAHQSIAVFFYR